MTASTLAAFLGMFLGQATSPPEIGVEKAAARIAKSSSKHSLTGRFVYDGMPPQPAILFPCAHPFLAVTDSDGKFRINRLPPGEWEFAAWHERRGYLKSEAWPRGRTTLKIDAETTDLGTIKLAPSQFVVQEAGDGSGASDVRQDANPVAR